MTWVASRFARARTACAVAARGLVCDALKIVFSIVSLPSPIVVVVVVVARARRRTASSLATSLEGFARVAGASTTDAAYRRARSRRLRAERGERVRGKHGRRRGHLGVRSTRARRRVRELPPGRLSRGVVGALEVVWCHRPVVTREIVPPRGRRNRALGGGTGRERRTRDDDGDHGRANRRCARCDGVRMDGRARAMRQPSTGGGGARWMWRRETTD